MAAREIWHEIHINASPGEVYQALTDVRKLAHWWTTDARGATLPNDIIKKSLAWLDGDAAEFAGNMLADVEAGRPSGLETQIGVIVRMAPTVGVEIPCHTFIYASLLPQDLKARGTLPK